MATADPRRQRAIVVSDKSVRVKNFHEQTVKALAEAVAAAGLAHPHDLRPHFLWQRISANTARNFAQLYPPLQKGELLDGCEDARFAGPWARAQADSFHAADRPWS